MGVMNEERLTLYDGLIKTHITDTTVAKEDGKGLSSNDYTTTEKNKLAGIATGANKTVVDSALSSTSQNPVQNKVIYTEITTLKKSVSDGKTLVATAITDKGVDTAADATFAVMAENIGQIETGGGELHGATISVSTSEENPTSITVTLTKDSTTVEEKNFDSNGLCTFTDIQEAGDYTVSATNGTDSNSITATVTSDNIVNKTVVSLTIDFTLDGSIATPVDDISIWLRTDSTGSSANAGYTTLTEVIADPDILGNLMRDKSAMQYLARSTGFAEEACADETFMTYLGASSHVDDTVLNSDIWFCKIINSQYMEIVMPGLIPTLSSNNDNGYVCSSHDPYDADKNYIPFSHKSFDPRIDGWIGWSSLNANPSELIIEFPDIKYVKLIKFYPFLYSGAFNSTDTVSKYIAATIDVYYKSTDGIWIKIQSVDVTESDGFNFVIQSVICKQNTTGIKFSYLGATYKDGSHREYGAMYKAQVY